MFRNAKFAFGRFLVSFSFSFAKKLVDFAASTSSQLEERGWKMIARNSDDMEAISAFAKAHYAQMGIKVEVYDARSAQALEALATSDGYEGMESPRRNGSSGGYYN